MLFPAPAVFEADALAAFSCHDVPKKERAGHADHVSAAFHLLEGFLFENKDLVRGRAGLHPLVARGRIAGQADFDQVVRRAFERLSAVGLVLCVDGRCAGGAEERQESGGDAAGKDLIHGFWPRVP